MLGNQQQQQQDDCEQHPESSLSETPKLPLLLPSPKVENCFPTFSESHLTHFMISPESSTRTSNSSPQSEHSNSYKGIFTSTLIFNRKKYKKYLFGVNKIMRKGSETEHYEGNLGSVLRTVRLESFPEVYSHCVKYFLTVDV